MYETSEFRNRVLIAGGGAAGCFAAITIKELAPYCEVLLLESSNVLLHKVSLSGGGRCNCTNNNFDRQTITRVYPRGAGFLRSVFSRFNNLSTIEWFENKSVSLKTEPDGRVFPGADTSEVITGVLKKLITDLSVKCITNSGIETAEKSKSDDGFCIKTSDGTNLFCEYLCIATGGVPETGGIKIARSLGHTIQSQIPSLYSFKIDEPKLSELAGISVQNIKISIPEFGISQNGDLLITHKGISGPAVIKLSSLSAPQIHEKKYNFTCRINWCDNQNIDDLYKMLDTWRKKNASLKIETQPVIKIPSRLWKFIISHSGCTEKQLWAHLSSHQREMIIQNLTRFAVHVCDRDQNKDEFVTCGGISCSEIDSRTMESKLVSKLYFAGEVIDIDALTGGYNLQAAWSTGWQAGTSITKEICLKSVTKSGKRDSNPQP